MVNHNLNCELKRRKSMNTALTNQKENSLNNISVLFAHGVKDQINFNYYSAPGHYDFHNQTWTIRCGETYTYSQTTNRPRSNHETNKDDKSTAD